MFRPVARRLLGESVFEQLRDRIVGGDVKPGSALPAERTLATLLKVNRNAVREGLKRLEQAGLVAIHQGGATRVLDFKRTAGLEVLSTMLVRSDGTIDTRICRGIVEMRTQLAPTVGSLAAERAHRANDTRLAAIVARMRKADGDVAAASRLALDFWAEVVAATQNIALELSFNSLDASYGIVIEQLENVMADEVTAIASYAALADAIRDRDAKLAASCAKRIVERGHASFMRLLAELDAAQSKGRS